MLSITVQINLPWRPKGVKNLTLGDGCTVGEMLAHLEMDQKQASSVLVVVNGKSNMSCDILADGDSVIILPVLDGG